VKKGEDCGYSCKAGVCGAHCNTDPGSKVEDSTCYYGECCGYSCAYDKPYIFCNVTGCEDVREDISGCNYYDYCSADLKNLEDCKNDLFSDNPTYYYCKVWGKTNEEMWEICKDDFYMPHGWATC